MEYKSLVLLFFCIVSVYSQGDPCDINHNKCSECVADAACGWCARSGKCWTGDSTGPTGGPTCPDQFWIYGGRSSILNTVSGFPVNPVHFDVYLAPDSPLALPVVVTNPQTDDVPLDLYIVEDVSGSMGDDLITFGDLAQNLVVDVLTYQSNPRFGLGSFGDKPIAPFGEESQGANVWPPNWDMVTGRGALNPCPTRTTNSGPWNWEFCHELDLTKNYNDLQKVVRTLIARKNIDWPEGSMTALMYTGVCNMGWRPDARKVVLLATDADYQTPYDITDPNIPLTMEEDYTCTAPNGANGIPGTAKNYPDENIVRNILASENIIPIIASANAPPNHQDFPTWEKLIKKWGFGQVFELESDSSNFISIIRDALTDLSTTMVMQLVKDVEQHVVGILPNNPDDPGKSSIYRNVEAGEQRYYTIELLTSQDPVVEQRIDLTVVGFGVVTINVTNSIPCVGCDGLKDSNSVIDLCGVCLPSNSPLIDACVGCDGRPYSGATLDRCGVCAGDSLSCVDCKGIRNGTAVWDACGVCDGDNSTCKGCDGIVNSGAKLDNCSVCLGSDECRGCDGIINSSLVFDACGVCGGLGNTCQSFEAPEPDKTPGVIIGIVGVLIAAILMAIVLILIFGIIGKKKFDEYQFMHNQQMSAVGANPLYSDAGGWHDNTLGN